MKRTLVMSLIVAAALAGCKRPNANQQTGQTGQTVGQQPGQMGGMPNQMGGMPNQMGGMPNQMGGMPNQMGGMPNQMGGMPGQMGGMQQAPMAGGGDACTQYAACCTALSAMTGTPNPACAQVQRLSQMGAMGQSTCQQMMANMRNIPNAPPACQGGMAMQAPGQMGGMPGQMGGMPGQMGGMPGQMGGMPGQMGQMGGGGGAVGMLQVGGMTAGALQASDAHLQDGSVGDDYNIMLTGGQPVTIVTRGGPAATGGTLDVYTVLLQNNNELTHDDDGAGYPNSRIVYTPPATGMYTIRVTTFGSGIKEGQYTVQVYPGALPSQT